MSQLPEHELIPTLKSFYGSVSTLSLSTVDAASLPHAANVYFAADDALHLIFISDPKTAHARHLEREARIAATIYAPVDDWQQIHGVQLHGTCYAVDAAECESCWNIYVARFPTVQPMHAMVMAQRFYRIRYTWLRWIDNRVSFGHKVEIER